MNLDQFYFTQAVNLEYANETYKEIVRSNISIKDNDIYRLRMIYKRMLAIIINDYFQTTSLDDTNFFTIAQIEDIFYAYNLLCGTDMEVDPEILDIDTSIDLYWRDYSIWNDTDIWTEHL